MKKQLPILWKPLNCLYVHINKLNNKKYFGITCKRPKERWANGRGYNQTQCAFYNAIQKYGWDGFEHKVIFKNLEDYVGDKTNLIFEPAINYNKKRKAQRVICLNTNKVYASILQAHKQTSCNQNEILRCCNHLITNTKGFKWMYEDEYKRSVFNEYKK